MQKNKINALLAKIETLRDENIQLRLNLTECQQRNDLFKKCTARALTLWQEKHPGRKMWPDTAKNLLWLAEEYWEVKIELMEALLKLGELQCKIRAEEPVACCIIWGCSNSAKWNIVHGSSPDDNTQACDAHLADLLCDHNIVMSLIEDRPAMDMA